MKKLFTPEFLLIPYELLNRRNLSPADLLVFGAVYWFERLKDGRCTAANDTIGAITKLHERTVRRSLERLEKEGFIVRIFRDGQNKKRTMIKVLISLKIDNKYDNVGRNRPTVGSTSPTAVGRNDPQNKNTNKNNLIRNDLYFQKRKLVNKFSMRNL
jgi:DNA-binding MarR family transcriptional regulator